MKNIQQLKKLMEELKLSPEGRRKFNEVFDQIEEKQIFTEEDKQTLLGLIDAEMFLKALTIKALDANIEEMDKVLAEA